MQICKHNPHAPSWRGHLRESHDARRASSPNMAFLHPLRTMAQVGEVPITDMRAESSRAKDTLALIDHFCGPGRAEIKERCRKYFERCDVNRDGVLEHAEVK